MDTLRAQDPSKKPQNPRRQLKKVGCNDTSFRAQLFQKMLIGKRKYNVLAALCECCNVGNVKTKHVYVNHFNFFKPIKALEEGAPASN